MFCWLNTVFPSQPQKTTNHKLTTNLNGFIFGDDVIDVKCDVIGLLQNLKQHLDVSVKA